MDGLEERFYINDREALAHALKERRCGLRAVTSKWDPEILSLLLELSDQPTRKSRLSELEALRPPEEDATQSLRWEDIAKEDGWDQDAAIWRSIKYGDSSDDELSYAHSDHLSHSSLASTSDAVDEEPGGRTAHDFIVNMEDVPLFNSIREAQQWRTTKPQTNSSRQARKIPVDETQVIREVLFMLQGLRTTLFDATNAVISSFQSSHIAWDTHKAVIGTFAESGRQLSILRTFTQHSQETPHMQAFQDSVSKRLQDFDGKLSQVQARLASPKDDTVVSLIGLKSELASWLEPLYALSDILFRISQASESSAFRYLELLFNEATVAQLSGKAETYAFLARIFVECFNVYLRPIRLWMDEGRLLPDDKIFFVNETSKDGPLSEIWRNRFKLRTTADGKLHAPDFLHPAVNKIMNAGKNIVVLAQLGQHATASFQKEEPPLDYDTICPPELDLAPFPDLFAAAFERWIQSKYRTTSTTLKDALFDKCDLSSALDALQYLYLMSDGSAALSFCQDLFVRTDSMMHNWYDRYALTAISHEAFESLVELSRLSINVDSKGQQIPTTSARDWVRSALPHLQITYRLAWPVQMIISPIAVKHYQAVFTLLLQFKKATHVLHKPKMLDHYWTDDERWSERALYYSCRNSLLWFCTTIQTYLSTLVLTPNVLLMRQQLQEAHDVDSIIAVHNAFTKRVVDEACLGSRLTPIREGMLDLLDLAIQLEQSHETYSCKNVLRGIKADFEKHLRFICGGLRSIARASGDSRSAKWDTLAEMLQMGSL